jgi:hypothetical protein
MSFCFKLNNVNFPIQNKLDLSTHLLNYTQVSLFCFTSNITRRFKILYLTSTFKNFKKMMNIINKIEKKKYKLFLMGQKLTHVQVI